jgi:hypothetical protein
METKKSSIIYADWINIFEKLEDDEAGRLIKYFFRYLNNIPSKKTDRITELMFEPIKNVLDRDSKKYESICLRNRNNGAQGGRPKSNVEKPSGFNNNPKKPDSDSDSDSDIKEKEKEKEKDFRNSQNDDQDEPEEKCIFITSLEKEKEIEDFNERLLANKI